MSKEKPSIPQGTRDFLPHQVQQRQFILQNIQKVFENFGFLPIETPAIEKLSTLTGKYGEEGDRLIFKILNSGNFLNDVNEQLWQEKNYTSLSYQICEKALRYDLTVPLARFVVMHQNEIVFPFKRYQIQPVWRGDSPQKGRYREFWQCDADIVGSDSLIYEVEFIQIYYHALKNLGFQQFFIHLNHRKILQAIVDALHLTDKFTDFCVAIDKLDKIQWKGVNNELLQRGFDNQVIEQIQKIFSPKDTLEETLSFLAQLFDNQEVGKKAIQEIQWIYDMVAASNSEILPHLKLDLTLARGLNYYTGCIFEVKLQGVHVGSIGGGGRYDNLTALFGKVGLSGAGISFGIDRIYDAMNELQLFQQLVLKMPVVFIVYFENIHLKKVFEIANFLRTNNIRTEISPKSDKLGKQIQLADKKSIPYVLIVGEQEILSNQYGLKNLSTGQQQVLSLTEIKEYLQDVGN
jgi:histidyl-tRNA synthetase